MGLNRNVFQVDVTCYFFLKDINNYNRFIHLVINEMKTRISINDVISLKLLFCLHIVDSDAQSCTFFQTIYLHQYLRR